MREQDEQMNPCEVTAEAPTPLSTPALASHRRSRVVALGAVVVVFGLLLWAKLLLVTGHPRTALADPDEQKASQADPTSETEAGAAAR